MDMLDRAAQAREVDSLITARTNTQQHTHLCEGPVVRQELCVPSLADQLLAITNLLVQLRQVELACVYENDWL